MNTCAECEFYQAINGKGYCKVTHPCLSATQEGVDARWPVVEGTEKACGDFARK